VDGATTKGETVGAIVATRAAGDAEGVFEVVPDAGAIVGRTYPLEQ